MLSISQSEYTNRNQKPHQRARNKPTDRVHQHHPSPHRHNHISHGRLVAGFCCTYTYTPATAAASLLLPGVCFSVRPRERVTTKATHAHTHTLAGSNTAPGTPQRARTQIARICNLYMHTRTPRSLSAPSAPAIPHACTWCVRISVRVAGSACG